MEDEGPIARALEIKLTREGFLVDTVTNGEEGVEKLKSTSYDAALIDLMMPSMNGFEVLEYMQKSAPDCCAIVLTNLSQKEDEEKARGLGAHDFFVKSDTSLATIVEQVKAKCKE